MAILRRLIRKPQALIGGGLVLGLLLIALLAPVIARADPLKQNPPMRLKPPSAQHWLGTDEFGRDLFSRIVYGGRATLKMGATSVAISATVGCTLGLLAGFYRGRVDLLISAATDILLAFPGFLLALAIVAMLGPSLQNAMIATGIQGIPTFARLVRGLIMSLREQPFLEAARGLGARDSRLIWRHLLPNALPTVIVQASLAYPSAILTGASLSFLGLGAQPPTPEWGALLVGARVYIRTAPWIVNAPGIAIMLAVLGFNLLGNAVRDTLDPRLKR